jgi:hypothetical protein
MQDLSLVLPLIPSPRIRATETSSVLYHHHFLPVRFRGQAYLIHQGPFGVLLYHLNRLDSALLQQLFMMSPLAVLLQMLSCTPQVTLGLVVSYAGGVVVKDM